MYTVKHSVKKRIATILILIILFYINANVFAAILDVELGKLEPDGKGEVNVEASAYSEEPLDPGTTINFQVTDPDTTNPIVSPGSYVFTGSENYQLVDGSQWSVSGDVYRYDIAYAFKPVPEHEYYNVSVHDDAGQYDSEDYYLSSYSQLNSIFIDGVEGIIFQDMYGEWRCSITLPYGTEPGNHEMDFEFDGAYVTMIEGNKEKIISPGDEFNFTGSNRIMWDNQYMRVYAPNNSYKEYELQIQAEPFIDIVYYIDSNNNRLSFNTWYFYSDVPGKDVIRLEINTREPLCDVILSAHLRFGSGGPGLEYTFDIPIEEDDQTQFFAELDLKDVAPELLDDGNIVDCEIRVSAKFQDINFTLTQILHPIINFYPSKIGLFDGSTTDWSSIEDYSNATVTFEVYGKNTITFENINLGSFYYFVLKMITDPVYFDLQNMGVVKTVFPTWSVFNTDSRITMHNLPFITAPAVICLSDGTAIPVESYSNGTLSFISPHSDTYVACPIISVDSLPSSTSSPTVNVSGNVNDAEAEVFVEVNGTSYRVTDFDTVTGNFSRDVTLRTGTNTIVVKAVNESMGYERMSSQAYSINYSTYADDEDDDDYDYDNGYSGGAPGGPQGDTSKDDEKKGPVVQEDGTVKVTVTSVKESGEAVASARLDNDTFKAAIGMAEADESGRREVRLSVECPEDTSACEISLPRHVVASGNSNDVLVLETGFTSIELPGNMFTDRSLGANQDVTLSITKLQNTDLEGPLKDAVGSRPVIEIGISRGDRKLSFNNPAAPVKISIPYTPTEEELKDPEHIVVWYIDGYGNIHSVPNGRYDPETGMVTFYVTHFSRYAVAYVKKTFDDIRLSAAKKEIEVLASKGIINGRSESIFAPLDNIKRADFLALLVRVFELDAKFESNFDDVQPGAYYYREVGIGKALGIVNGIGDNLFNPDSYITRQDMIVMAGRALEYVDSLNIKATPGNINQYSDKDNISAYAMPYMAYFLSNKLFVPEDSSIKPQYLVMREEAAKLIYNLYNRKR